MTATITCDPRKRLACNFLAPRAPSIIVAENPTRGLDIRAAAAVRERLREAAARGAAVLLYSSDLDEVLAVATRVVAVHRGRLTEVPNERESVGRAMLGLP